MEGSDDPMDRVEANKGTSIMLDVAQQKRKGGRKLIHATVEQRKQRNRQAQAAFRERRTEYIKELEDAIEIHKADSRRSQAAHAKATDECLMLRYKNSLLERILLEKGVDVQAELREKNGNPSWGPVKASTKSPQRRTGASSSNDVSKRPRTSSPAPQFTAQSRDSPLSVASPSLCSTSPSNQSSHSPATPVSDYFFGSNPLATPTEDVATRTSDLFPRQQSTNVSPQMNSTFDGMQQALVCVIKQQKSQKAGSMRDAAAYYLSSFLDHIEQLGKLARAPSTNLLYGTFVVLD